VVSVEDEATPPPPHPQQASVAAIPSTAYLLNGPFASSLQTGPYPPDEVHHLLSTYFAQSSESTSFQSGGKSTQALTGSLVVVLVVMTEGRGSITPKSIVGGGSAVVEVELVAPTRHNSQPMSVPDGPVVQVILLVGCMSMGPLKRKKPTPST
jgi:hypothetical protein